MDYVAPPNCEIAKNHVNMKMIFNNLWNRRRNNVWLFVELVLITLLTWVMADNVAVSVADRSLPVGYDSDRLVIAGVASLPPSAPGYRGEYDSVAANAEAVAAIMQQLRALDGVERATNMGDASLIGGQSSTTTAMGTGNAAVDTLVKAVHMATFEPGEEFFETYGFSDVPGSPTVAELSARRLGEREIIVSREYAELFWPGENATGKCFKSEIAGGDTMATVIAGVVGGARWTTALRSYCMVFQNNRRAEHRNKPVSDFNVVLRLRADTDHGEFIASLRNGRVQAGNFYVQSATDYSDFLHETEESLGIHTEQRQMVVLAVFFLLNLVLGTIGCFWLQTGRRTGEMGVLRSFGARRSHIVAMLTGESVVLTLAAWATGELLYLQFALRNGLATGHAGNDNINVLDNWVSHFGTHFAVVSAIVLAVLLASVVTGTLIPAIRASRVNVSEALRDE